MLIIGINYGLCYGDIKSVVGGRQSRDVVNKMKKNARSRISWESSELLSLDVFESPRRFHYRDISIRVYKDVGGSVGVLW